MLEIKSTRGCKQETAYVCVPLQPGRERNSWGGSNLRKDHQYSIIEEIISIEVYGVNSGRRDRGEGIPTTVYHARTNYGSRAYQVEFKWGAGGVDPLGRRRRQPKNVETDGQNCVRYFVCSETWTVLFMSGENTVCCTYKEQNKRRYPSNIGRPLFDIWCV